ncbi:CPBP family intramembrane glutamic endopeptidase [Fulvivirga lutimaris]|uniref:CPBP family intramembrane glutamic endopeptidase n=1 Tax=Fulvivirga lutimaris TaxID=1819566 RepID=UPI0012BB76AE|nr:CPBP family intramembrane glutamic endopeptidase [Fulvivirga lutimaris]MTI39560.1 CPBP family intramembrane metalloprotease [Fulvivirga lutimaris]
MKKNVIRDLVIGILILSILLFLNLSIPYVKIIFSGLIVLIYTGLTGGLKDRVGFKTPKSWINDSVLGLGLGLFIVSFSYFISIPIITYVTGDTLSIGSFQQIKGNTAVLYTSLAIGWVIGGFFEEVIFRGFLLGRILKIKDNTWIEIVGVIFTSLLFGYLHGYQGFTGQITVTLTGIFLALIFIFNKRSIWLNIITHGCINTISMLCVYTGFVEV